MGNSNQYQPKLNPKAALYGYLGVDPAKTGTLEGYSQDIVDRDALKAQKPSNNDGAKRKAPHLGR